MESLYPPCTVPGTEQPLIPRLPYPFPFNSCPQQPTSGALVGRAPFIQPPVGNLQEETEAATTNLPNLGWPWPR